MSFYECCMNRSPPSPEGFAPRPVELARDAHTGTFGSMESRLSKSEDAAELRAIFEGDLSDTDDERNNLMTKPSSSTLNAVKMKLRKHLSRESAISRHRPHSTVGNSDEEVERRKELKLIRDRRIKEELSSGVAYDDDAKSLATFTTGNSPYDEPGVTKYQQDLSPTEVFDGFAVPCLSKQRSEDCLYSQKLSECPLLIPRRHSLAILNNQGSPAGTAPEWAVRGLNSISTVPAAPMLKPRRLSSIADPATRRTSWRLSFASDQRASQLRSLSQGLVVPPGHGTAVIENVSVKPLRWFRGEAIHVSPLAVQNPSADVIDSERISTQAALSSSVEDFGGIDGITESNLPPVRLHEMKISQRLASRGLYSYSSSPQLSSWGSHFNFRRRSCSSRASNCEPKSLTQHYWHVSDTDFADCKRSTSPEISHDGVLSLSSSIENTIHTQLNSSRFNLVSLIMPKRSKTSFHPLVSKSKNLTSSSEAGDRGSDATLSIPLVTQNHRRVLDDSVTASETSSFHKREAELDVVKSRFPRFMQRTSRKSPVQSRFKEDFDESRTATYAVSDNDESSSSPLKVPRISRLMSKSYDGASPLELHVPRLRQGFGYNFSDRSHSIVGTVSPRTRNPGATLLDNENSESPHPREDGTEQIWAQALQRTQEEYVLKAEADLMEANADKKSSPRSFSVIRSLSWKMKGKNKASTSSFKELESERLVVDGRGFDLDLHLRRQALQAEIQRAKVDQWANELQARELQAKAKTIAEGQESSTASVGIPSGSWARFPSHTRPERTASAGLLDKVAPKDFAIKTVNEGVIEWMKSDRKHHHHHHVKEQHHSLPIRVSNQIRASLYKLRTMKSTARSDVIHGRQSSISVGGKLEYPELEMLAGDFAGNEDYEQAERDAAAQMRIDERSARMAIVGDGSLDGKNDDGDDEIEENETSQVSIADPRFYEDCIFLSMEEDNQDDAKSATSNATVAVVKGKQRTWSDGVRAPFLLLDSMALRKSTIDFQRELEVTETVERHRAIKSAEEAWGAIVT